MKTIDERIKEHEWLEGHTWILTSEAAETIAQQHAEEYAKAMIEWLRKTQFAGELTTETVYKFKESLKK